MLLATEGAAERREIMHALCGALCGYPSFENRRSQCEQEIVDAI
jgi:hypothetical protein